MQNNEQEYYEYQQMEREEKIQKWIEDINLGISINGKKETIKRIAEILQEKDRVIKGLSEYKERYEMDKVTESMKELINIGNLERWDNGKTN